MMTFFEPVTHEFLMNNFLCILIIILPVQVRPSPLNPGLHMQITEPKVFKQAAFTSQKGEKHSLIS